MYADQIAQSSTKSFIDNLFTRRYTPADFDEEFLDKIGVLGVTTFFHMNNRFPLGYTYDNRDDRAVTITIDNDKGIQLSKQEIAAVKEDIASTLFYEFQQKIEEKYLHVMEQ